MYGESTAALIFEISRRITEAAEKSKEALWLGRRLSLEVQRENELSILTVVREKYDVELGAS